MVISQSNSFQKILAILDLHAGKKVEVSKDDFSQNMVIISTTFVTW